MQDEASYICDSCGEEIVIPIDLTAGTTQDYVEDCPVCCHPSLIHIDVDETDGSVRAWAEAEQDRY
ncbi:MAG: CPXCG motif-containing cysteine-rich protein [Planctomycetota bacterium]